MTVALGENNDMHESIDNDDYNDLIEKYDATLYKSEFFCHI